jgi:hypothetical protein
MQAMVPPVLDLGFQSPEQQQWEIEDTFFRRLDQVLPAVCH